jgi:cell division protein FtsA
MADVFMIPKNFYNGLIDAFDKIWLVVADIIPNILAASEIAVDYDHKDLGTVLVDIGKNQTSYVIYEDWYPLGYGTLPIGWEEVTKDISIWMQVDIKEAEDIKRSNWSCIIDSETPQDLPLDTHFLTEIISARYEQIFGKINDHLFKLEKDWRLPWGILLLWWWAKIKYIDILSKEVFKLATFYAKDQVINIGDLSNNIQFLNIIWCYYRSLKYVEEGRHGWWGINIWKTMWKIWKFFKDLF